MEPLQVAAWRWVAGMQPTEDLPDLATDALVRGKDTPALRELAGAAPDDYWLIKGLFEKVAEELGLDLPDEQAALWELARHKAAQIVSGEVDPSTGAHWIWSEICHRIDREGDLRIFIGLADEWDDYPRYRAELETRITRAAEELVPQQEPRTWVRVQARQGGSPVVLSGTRQELPVGSLPVAADLVEAFDKWAADYETTYVPGSEGFTSEADADAFVARGQDLVDRLQAELGDSWHVEYVPEPRRPPGVRIRT